MTRRPIPTAPDGMRVAFGYETRPGHPIYGEESFQIDAHGVLTARSISCPSSWRWRLLGPAIQRATHIRDVQIVQHAAVRVGRR